ncbi:unnamed protein product, partial [marine sediment metagenome]
SELGLEKKQIRLSLYFRTQTLQKQIAEAIQEELQNNLGIRVDLYQVEGKLFVEKLQKHQFQLALTFLSAQYPDPLNLLDRFKYKHQLKNYSQYENKKLTHLLDLAKACQDLKKRIEFIKAAESVLLSDMPLIPLYHCNYTALIQPYVKNAKIGPFGDLHFDQVCIDDK